MPGNNPVQKESIKKEYYDIIDNQCKKISLISFYVFKETI